MRCGYYVAFLAYYISHLQNKIIFSFAKKNAFPLFPGVSEYIHFVSPLFNCYHFHLCQACQQNYRENHVHELLVHLRQGDSTGLNIESIKGF